MSSPKLEGIWISEGACLLHSATPAHVATQVTLLPAGSLALSKVAETVAAHRAAHGMNDLAWKIIGSEQAAREVARHLAELNEKVEKTVERAGSFEAVHIAKEGRLRVPRAEVKVAPEERCGAKPLKVLIVDDSSSMRGILKKMVEADSDMIVVAAATKPSETEALILEHRPDVITLDIHMPEEDGVSLLRRLHPKYRIPTIMVTAISLQESRQVFDALEIGAVDYVQKPEFSEIASLGATLREKIRVAAKAFLKPESSGPASSFELEVGAMNLNSLIVIGSSTGGTEALKKVLTSLPEHIPPILIAQHIPPIFSKAFADRMNQLCPFEVIEGSEPDIEVVPNRVIVAAGGTQMGVRNRGGKLRITVEPEAEPVNRHKPSVDYLFQSVLKSFTGPRAGVILTGMGADGAKGLKALRDEGWFTIAQDESTSIVFGMPKEAIRLGGAEQILPLPAIAAALATKLKR